jgi:hypothetical protein
MLNFTLFKKWEMNILRQLSGPAASQVIVRNDMAGCVESVAHKNVRVHVHFATAHVKIHRERLIISVMSFELFGKWEMNTLRQLSVPAAGLAGFVG